MFGVNIALDMFKFKFNNFVRKINLAPFIVLLISMGLFNQAVAEYFRWVDDDGVVHYTDTIPPSKAQRKQEKLNETGRVVESIPKPKSVDELEDETRLGKLKEEQKKLKIEKEKRDRMLLAMYVSVEDIEYVRDERIATVDSAIEITKIRKSKFLKKLQDLDASEQRFKDSGADAPQWLINSRDHYKEQISNVDAILEIKMKEKQGINKLFERDINRYIELKGSKSTIH